MDNNNDSSGMSVMVGIVAIVAVLAVVYFAVQIMNNKADDNGTPQVIDVNLGGNSSTAN